MSYNNNTENSTIESHLDDADLKILSDIFKSCSDNLQVTLGSLIGDNSIIVSAVDIQVSTAESIIGSTDEIMLKIPLKSGLPGYFLMRLSKDLCKYIANSMMGADTSASIDDEIMISAVSEAMNQLIGSSCVLLSRSINDTIDIGTPDTVDISSATTESLFGGTFKDSATVCKVDHKLSVNNEDITFTFVTGINAAKSASFKAKTTENKNLLKSNPELLKTIAEYFTLLGVKYKAIYSMIGLVDNVSVLEINSIHSLQYLDADVIKNYNIVNKNKQKDFFNTFIFEKEFVSDMKNKSGMVDDDDSTWDILKELNNQFMYIFLEYCSDTNLTFDNVECNNFLELPDNQYLLISFSVGSYRFYQLLSFGLIDKIQLKLSRADKERIKDKSIANISKLDYNPENNESVQMNSLNCLPEIYRNIPFEVSVVLGEKMYSVKDLLHFDTGFIIHLNRKITDDVDICINNIKKAEGEVGELTYNKSNNYAVKIKKLQKE